MTALEIVRFGLVPAEKLPVVIALAIASLFILILIPMAAKRSKLHIPGYVGIAFLALALGFLTGGIAGMHSVAGSAFGVALSIVFFLSMSVAAGSVLALFFYRPTEV
jgi:uncharacterized membrane protein